MRRMAWRVFLGLALGAVGMSCGDGPLAASSASDLIAKRGPPPIFSVVCGRHAYDGTAHAWRPTDGFVRIDSWMYPADSKSWVGQEVAATDVYVLVDGEVVKSARTDRSIRSYPGRGFNPRRIGCGETEATMNQLSELGAPRLSTEGKAPANAVVFGTSHLKVNYHASFSSIGGFLVTYSNGKLIGMSSL